MSNGTNIPGPGTPMVDKDGNLTQVWWQFLVTMFNRTGGTNNPNDLSALTTQVNAQKGQINDLFKLENGQAQASLFGALMQRVVALEKQVQSVVPVRQAVPQTLPDPVALRVKDPTTDLYKMVSK